jgi:pimeloyl-ACP methyl ester carboxylesterase
MKSATLLFLFSVILSFGQNPPYDIFPEAEPPYYRIRYEASKDSKELQFPVKFTIWIPEGIKNIKGIVVHQHGCGEGSCSSGLTGAWDLHWQALAQKHHCALLAPSYEQPQKADCQLWCDPRNGSGKAFFKALADLGEMCEHPELSQIPWALWGHSGGGHWAGGMTMLYPERVAACWLRSGVPLFEANPKRVSIRPHMLNPASLEVPIMCNPGTKEGVTEKTGRFAGVWPANETFFAKVRGSGGLVGVAIDPLSAHECGNQRYLAIPWLDACLSERLPKRAGQPLRNMLIDKAWLAPVLGKKAVPAKKFIRNPNKAIWLPNQKIAKIWMHYVRDTEIPDTTPPPTPTNLRTSSMGTNKNQLTWEAKADFESGLSYFIIQKDGKVIGQVPEKPANRFGRPLFQGLLYSDTPTQPLVEMEFIDSEADMQTFYEVIAVNTAGLESSPAQLATIKVK